MNLLIPAPIPLTPWFVLILSCFAASRMEVPSATSISWFSFETRRIHVENIVKPRTGEYRRIYRENTVKKHTRRKSQYGFQNHTKKTHNHTQGMNLLTCSMFYKEKTNIVNSNIVFSNCFSKSAKECF